MAKVTFFCDSGANIHSCRKETIDTVNDLGFEDGEWESLSDDEKYKEVQQWAFDFIDMGFIEE